MFCASWNDVYPTDMIYCNNTNSYGYYVGTSSTPTTLEFGREPTVADSNSLYYPHPFASGNIYNGCMGYWLASPSAQLLNRVIYVPSRGVSYNGYDYRNVCLRPLVRLKSTTKLTAGTNGFDYDLIAN